MTGWIITAAVFAFFAMILITNVKCKLFYRDEKLLVKVGFWCFWFTLFPAKEKKEKPKKERGKKQASTPRAEKEPAEKKEKLDFGLVKNLISSGLKGLKTLWRHLVFHGLRLRITVGDEDAAECALRYGKLCGVVHGGIAAAKNLAHLEAKEISLSCDFTKNKTVYDIEAAARIRIVFIFGAAFRMLFNLAVNTIRNSRQES